MHADAPTLGLYMPAGQAVWEVPWAGQAYPALHCVHTDAPAWEYHPEGQGNAVSVSVLGQ